jgi:hypothetical protein
MITCQGCGAQVEARSLNKKWCAACRLQRGRDYYAANQEKIRERKCRYWAANRGKISERRRAARERGRRRVMITCLDCGNRVEASRSNQKRCTACRPRAARERERRWKAANLDKIRVREQTRRRRRRANACLMQCRICSHTLTNRRALYCSALCRKEAHREQRRRWLAANPDKVERDRARTHRWRATNQVRVREHDRERYYRRGRAAQRREQGRELMRVRKALIAVLEKFCFPDGPPPASKAERARRGTALLQAARERGLLPPAYSRSTTTPDEQPATE